MSQEFAVSIRYQRVSPLNQVRCAQGSDAVPTVSIRYLRVSHLNQAISFLANSSIRFQSAICASYLSTEIYTYRLAAGPQFQSAICASHISTNTWTWQPFESVQFQSAISASHLSTEFGNAQSQTPSCFNPLSARLTSQRITEDS